MYSFVELPNKAVKVVNSCMRGMNCRWRLCDYKSTSWYVLFSVLLWQLLSEKVVWFALWSSKTDTRIGRHSQRVSHYDLFFFVFKSENLPCQVILDRQKLLILRTLHSYGVRSKLLNEKIGIQIVGKSLYYTKLRGLCESPLSWKFVISAFWDII